MTLDDIGENGTALFCMTNFSACCRPPFTNGSIRGNWFFPNGTRVPSVSNQYNFYRTRDQMAVWLHHRGSGVDGIYCCKIPESMNVTQSIYIGVYNTRTGE